MKSYRTLGISAVQLRHLLSGLAGKTRLSCFVALEAFNYDATFLSKTSKPLKILFIL